jgi:pyruvate dehydrogenase E1 component alpha subunit
MLFKQRVTEAGLLDSADMDEIEKESKALIEQCLVDAKAGDLPTRSDLMTDVYLDYRF